MTELGERDREQAERLLSQRAQARATRNFALADDLRARIGELGFDVVDSSKGSDLADKPLVDPKLVASVHVLYEGFESDLARFVRGMRGCAADMEIVVAVHGTEHPAFPDDEGRTRVVEVEATGWAQAQNEAAHASRGEVIIFADTSVEPHGDILTPIIETIRDPSVGIAGGWGLVTDDLREFRSAEGPQVHAVEGYLIALRRDVFESTGFDPWFTWYRHADLDLSFRVRALGLRAVAVPVPAVRREHRGWAAVPEPERSRLSKRNFYRFLNRWRDRTDLLRLGA